jgi:hypothetical protein
MTVDDLYTQLSALSAQLDSAFSADAKFDLQTLIWQIEKQIEAEGFDPLTDLSATAGPEVDQLEELIPQVDLAITTEEKRVQLVEAIISLATSALSAAGMTLP